jgi:hypothetical protein
MSRFRQEWDLVPTAAKVIAVLAALFIVTLMGFIFIVAPLVDTGAPPPALWGFFILTSFIPSILMFVFILLVGYVWADAGRRGMNQAGWTLLAIFIPSAIGIILYFVLRDPLPVPCPSCETPAGRGQAFCAACGTELRRSCPSCQKPVENGWSHCGHCGAALRRPTAPSQP